MWHVHVCEYGINLKFGHLTLLAYMVVFLRKILNQYDEHIISCNYLKMENKKGYKTPFRWSGHIFCSLKYDSEIHLFQKSYAGIYHALSYQIFIILFKLHEGGGPET